MNEPAWQVRRLHAPELAEHGGPIELSAESLQHARVLRLRVGDAIELFDARGHRARATLRELSGRRGLCDAQARAFEPAPAPALHLILGMPKADKLDNVVRMLTELGAGSIHIALTERCVPKPRDASARMERLARIAREACAQSGQPFAPELHAPAPLEQVSARAPVDAERWVLWEESSAPKPMRGSRANAEPGELREAQEMWVVVGPEGGLARHEVEALERRGFVHVGLGPAILRFETAAVAATVLALERLGRLRP